MVLGVDKSIRVMVKTSINDDRRNIEKLVSEQDNIDISRRAAKSRLPSRIVRVSSPTESDGRIFDNSECDIDRGWVGWDSKLESLHLGDMQNDNHVDSIETSKKISESSSKTFNATNISCIKMLGKQNAGQDSTKAYGKINDNCQNKTEEDEEKTFGYFQASIGWASNGICNSSHRSERRDGILEEEMYVHQKRVVD